MNSYIVDVEIQNAMGVKNIDMVLGSWVLKWFHYNN